MIIDHYDGFGLNDIIRIEADERDPENGGCSHVYVLTMPDPSDPTVQVEVARIQYQCGPRHVEGSVQGVTDQAVLAVILDRYRGFQAGPFACRENALVITNLEEAMLWMKDRTFKRAARGVLGTLTP